MRVAKPVPGFQHQRDPPVPCLLGEECNAALGIRSGEGRAYASGAVRRIASFAP